MQYVQYNYRKISLYSYFDNNVVLSASPQMDHFPTLSYANSVKSHTFVHVLEFILLNFKLLM